MPSFFSEDDLYLFGEGTWLRAYEKMGAHPRVVDGVQGTNVAVWAPEAERVGVIGDFNDWRAGQTPLAPPGGGGVWEASVPERHTDDLYKYGIHSRPHG